MSENDSFISEVAEEVRRDRLVRTLRKYAWLIVGVLVLIIGAAAYSEWQKAQTRAAAEARGDAILAALEGDDTTGALLALEGETAQTAVVRLQLATSQAQDDKLDDAIATLSSLAADNSVSSVYRDVARLKVVMLRGRDMPAEERLSILEALTSEGNPMRFLALEQRALVYLDEGDRDAALADFATVAEGQGASRTQRTRAQQMIVALGGTLPGADAPADG